MKQLLNSAVLEMQLLVVFFFCKMLETADWDIHIIFSFFSVSFQFSNNIPCVCTHSFRKVFTKVSGDSPRCFARFYFTEDRGGVAMCLFFHLGKGLGCYVYFF